MSKLVYGVGVNDLDYRTQVKEYVTKDGGERVRKPVFICKYYAVWRDMLSRCYSKNAWKADQAILTLAYVVSGCPLQHLKNGWRSKTGVVSAWTKILLFQEANYIHLKQVLLCCKQQTILLLQTMRFEVITPLVYIFINLRASIAPVVKTLSLESRKT